MRQSTIQTTIEKERQSFRESVRDSIGGPLGDTARKLRESSADLRAAAEKDTKMNNYQDDGNGGGSLEDRQDKGKPLEVKVE